jgi:serine/threonine protein kinase/tetratricopeptide (TPR) repeat protein
MHGIPLGPFELHETVGEGGMGEVWRGVHVAQQVPVAIKLLTAKTAQQAGYRACFRTEVQSVARLHHPNIVMIFDYGDVPYETERQSEGRLQAGTPYFVMEFLAGGPLYETNRSRRWSTIRGVLLALLDALAHAHARGVIHRDIKSSNVLVVEEGHEISDVKLTDFGVAHALDPLTDPTPSRRSSGTRENPIGSPSTMAPEQFEGVWREYGPWTDLYSLGCLAFELATGEVPFGGNTFMDLAIAHMREPVPRVPTSLSVPAGFEAWVHHLMAKEPQDRFQRAAEAAWELTQLESPDDDRSLPPGGGGLDMPAASDATGKTLRAIWSVTLGSSPDETGLPGATGTAHLPTPDTWRRTDPPPPLMPLVGAGLGLYGLRTVPLVDRDSERDTIWKALATVSETGRPRMLVCRGEAGVGKSRLVEWVAERAHELGAATILKAVHSPILGRADGLAPMVARHLRCVGLKQIKLHKRLKKLLNDDGVTARYERYALAELIAPTTDEEAAAGLRSMRFSGPVERHLVVSRLLERLGRKRPLILWLDDLHWGADALGFVAQLLGSALEAPCPVLVLATVRNDVLADRPIESSLLEHLTALDAVDSMTVGPLPDADQAELIDSLLGLESEFAEHLQQRTRGNPLFAIQLVGDWIGRGVLEVGRWGFVLRPGEQADLPDEIHDLWAQRVARLTQDVSAFTPHAADEPESAPETRRHDALLALELAAVLGKDVDVGEWSSVCRRASLSIPDWMPELLVQNRLAEPLEGGWSFIHGMLRESVERLAREAGRWERHNRTCAAMIGIRYTLAEPGIPERLSRHLLAASDFQEVVEPLLSAARQCIDASDFRRAHSLLCDLEDALDRLGVAENDIRRASGWLLRSVVFRFQIDFDAARGWAEKAFALALSSGAPAVRADASFCRADILLELSEFDDARRLYRSASELYRKLSNLSGVAKCVHGLGRVAWKRGSLEDSKTFNLEAWDLFRDLGDRQGVSACLRMLGNVALNRGEVQGAQKLYVAAKQLLHDIGDHFYLAHCENCLGEAARFGGDLAASESHYRAAIAIMTSIGSGDVAVPESNLGLLLLMRDEYDEARPILERALESFTKAGQRSLVAALIASLLPCVAQSGDWRAWNTHLDELTELLDQTGTVNVDIAWSAERAGDLCLAAGESEKAAAAFEIALAQWEALGRSQEVLAIEAKT